MWKKIKQCAEFIGYMELGIFIVVLIAVLIYIDRDERRIERDLVVKLEVPPMPVRKDMPSSSSKEGADYFRVVKPEHWKYLIEDMSRWSDSTRTEGWMTFPKSMPGYMDLVAMEADGPYYLWAQDKRYFPQGTLLRIYEIRQDSTRIQLLFTVDRDMAAMRNDMAGRLDDLLKDMNNPENME